jgi:hypothetical protein
MRLDPKVRATHWSVTAFYDTPKTPAKSTREYQIEDARRKGWIVSGQPEKCPETGAFHFQLSVKTPQVRARAIMDIFPQAEVQVARNGPALDNYVLKEETRAGELKKVSVAITWSNVCDKFFDWLYQSDIEELWKTRDYEKRMELWDEFIDESIGQGIRCELIGVNPQYRSSIQKYWNGMCVQAQARRQDRQQDRLSVDSDRQTDTAEVSLPMYV